MKFTCLSENLAKGVAVVGKAVTAKGSLPVLSHILLATDEGRLKLCATDLETAVTTWVFGKVEAEGSLSVPARLLWELISQLPPGKVELVGEGNSLLILTDPPLNESRLNGMAGSEFPPLSEISGRKLFSLSPSDFSAAVGSVAFAAAKEESRPILTGVLLKGAGAGLVLVGVDGFRLAEKKIDLPAGVSLPDSFAAVVPAKTLSEVARLAQSQSEPVEVYVVSEENQLRFGLAGTCVLARLLEGQFPDYERIIPPSFSTRAKLATEEFLRAVKLASIFAKGGSSIVKLSFMKPGTLTLSGRADEVGEHRTQVACELEGEPLDIAFNSRYLIDFLANFGQEDVVFEASGALNPGVLKHVSSPDYLHLIMPVRLAD